MLYKDFIQDFAKRTFENLKTVCQDKPRYEVTQLLNSCLGLLVFPKEKYFETFWKHEPTMDFPNIQIKNVAGKIVCSQKLDGNPCRCVSHFGHMLRHLRNAVSHGKIETSPDTTIDGIERVCFTDNGQVEIDMSIGEVYNVLMSVLYLILDKDKQAFLTTKPEECARIFKTELDVYGIRGNE